MHGAFVKDNLVIISAKRLYNLTVCYLGPVDARLPGYAVVSTAVQNGFKDALIPRETPPLYPYRHDTWG